MAGRLRQREGSEVQPFTQLQTEGPARQAPPVQPPPQLQQQDVHQQAQALSANLDRVGQSVSRQAERLDSSLPLTQRAGEEKGRQVEESARQIEAERPAEAAELKKSGELAKDELEEAKKARSAGDGAKADLHTEKAREHLDSALEKADAIGRLDLAVRELKDAGAPSEIIGTMKTVSVKPMVARELASYARSATEDLKKAPAEDRSAIGSIYSRGLLSLKAGKKVDADLHSAMAKAYPRASAADKKKIDDASSSSAKGRMSAADVMALMSALRTGPSGAGIPPGKIRERLLALQKKIIELSGIHGRSSDISKISALVSPATRYIARAEEARRTGDDAKAAEFEELAIRHLGEAEALVKEVESRIPPRPVAPKEAKPPPPEIAAAESVEVGPMTAAGVPVEEPKPVEGPKEDPLPGFIAMESELADPSERKKLETVTESLSSGKIKSGDALRVLGSFYDTRIRALMEHFEKADPETIKNLMNIILPLGGAPSLSDIETGAAASGLAGIYASEPSKRKDIESLIGGISEGKISTSSAFAYLSLYHKREEIDLSSGKMKFDEERCGPEFAIAMIDSALGKIARGEDPAREMGLIETGVALLPAIEASFSGAKDEEGRKALEEIYLSMQDALIAGDEGKAKALSASASVYSATAIPDLKEYVHSIASRLSKAELTSDGASVLIGFAAEMADSESSISKSDLGLEKKGEALLNLRSYFGIGASLYEKGDRIGAGYAATLGKMYSSAVLLGDSSFEDWIKSVLGDFGGSEAVAFGKTFGLKPSDWAMISLPSGAPGLLAASSSSSFSDELAKTGKSLDDLDLEIAESHSGIAVAAITAKADSIDEPDLREKFMMALGPEGAEDYERLEKGVLGAFSLGGEGGELAREAASLRREAAGLGMAGDPGEKTRLLHEAESKGARGTLLLGLSSRILDVHTAEKESALLHSPSKESGRAELAHAREIYIEVAEKLAHGEATAEDLAKLADADSAYKTGLEKVAYEKAIGKAISAEKAALKKVERRHAELKDSWKDEKATFPYEWEEVEKDLKKAAYYLKKGDLPKARLARARASSKAEIYSEKAEILRAYPKAGAGAKAYDLPKILSSLDEALAKSARNDFKGARKLLSAASSARMVGGARTVYEGMVIDDEKDIETLSGLEATISSHEGESGKSKEYLDALSVVLDPLKDTIRDKKAEISRDAEEAAGKRDLIKTLADIDGGKIKSDYEAHAGRRAKLSDFTMGAGFAMEMGERGARYVDLSVAMGKVPSGLYDDALSLAAGEYLRLGKAAASDPGGIRKSIVEGKKLYLPEMRHTVKGDAHMSDRVIAIPAAELAADEALKGATDRVLAVGATKALERWDPEMSEDVASADAEITIALSFGLGKGSKGDYRELKFVPGEKEYLLKLKEGLDKTKGWFFGYAFMKSPLSYDDRVEGLTAAGELGRMIGTKTLPAVSGIADRGETTDALSMNIKEKMDNEALLIDHSITKAEEKIAGSIRAATESERKWAFAGSAAEFFSVNLASAVTGGLAAPLYYAFKSGITIGEAEISGAWDEMGSGAKAMMWAGVGLSVAGLALAGTGALVSGFGKEAVAASSVLSSVDRAVRYGGYGLLAGGTAMAGIELHHAIGSGGKWYEVGFLLFTNIAPHFATAAPIVIPKSKFAGFGHTAKGRFLTSLLSGSSPEEAEGMLWREHDEARYKKYLELPDLHKDAYHSVEIAIGRELSPEEGLKVIAKLGTPSLDATTDAGKAAFAKAAAADLSAPALAAPPAIKPPAPEAAPGPDPVRIKIDEALLEYDFFEGHPLSAEEKKAIADNLHSTAKARGMAPDAAAAYVKDILAGSPEGIPAIKPMDPAAKSEKFASDATEKYSGPPSGFEPPGEPPGGAPPPMGPSGKDPASRHEEFAADILAKYELGNPEKLRDFVGRLIKSDPEALKAAEAFADRPEVRIAGEMLAEAREKRLLKTAPERFIKGDLLRIAEKYAPRISAEGLKAVSPEGMGIVPPGISGKAEAGLGGSLHDRIESIYRKRDGGGALSPEETEIVNGVDALVAKGMRRDSAVAFFEDAALRPHKIPLSSAAPGSFKGSDAALYKRKVPLLEGGMTKEGFFEDAPRARIDEAIDLDLKGEETGSSARAYKAEIMLDGRTMEVAVKLFKVPSEEKFGHMLSEVANMGELGTVPGFAEFAPKCYGVVNVDGNFGYAMDYVPGKPIDLSVTSADEIRRYVSPKTYEKIEKMYRLLLDANFDVGDFQFGVLTEKAVINGIAKEPGDVVMWDFPKDPKRMTMSLPEREARLAETLSAIKGSADRIVVEGTIRPGSPEHKAVEEISRGAMGIELSRKTGTAMLPERVRDPIRQFLLLGPDKRSSLAREFIEKMRLSDPASAARLEERLKTIGASSGVRLID